MNYTEIMEQLRQSEERRQMMLAQFSQTAEAPAQILQSLNKWGEALNELMSIPPM